MRTKIMANRNWRDIADYQLENFYSKDDEQNKKDMEKLMKLYNSEVFDEFLGDPKCASCGALATNRCSKCKSEWYCGREC
jgi:predicted Zn-ribbon and HTH transcriptional regulator